MLGCRTIGLSMGKENTVTHKPRRGATTRAIPRPIFDKSPASAEDQWQEYTESPDYLYGGSRKPDMDGLYPGMDGWEGSR